MVQVVGFEHQQLGADLGGPTAEAGLVTSDRQGRETRYQLTLEPLADAVSWMAAVGAQSDDRLQALARYLDPGAPRPRRRRPGFSAGA